jgi:ATP-binding cassette subfamily B protein/ATP-binding cassette subfamily C protein
MNISIIKKIPKQLRYLLPKQYKIYMLILLVLTIILSVIETIGISIVMPFISIIAKPEILKNGIYNTVFKISKCSSANSFIVIFGIIIAAFYCFRTGYTAVYAYILNKVSLGLYRHFIRLLFKVYNNLPYKNFLNVNPSELTKFIIFDSNNTNCFIVALLQAFSEAFTIMILYCVIFVVNWKMTLGLTIFLLLVSWFILFTITRQSRRQGVKLSEANKGLYAILSETFGNFKFLKLIGNREEIYVNFEKNTKKLAKAKVLMGTFDVLPRLILENIGFVSLIVAVIFILWQYDSTDKIIPILSMYALALYRILPSFSRLLYQLNIIAFNQKSLDMVFNEISQETEKANFEPINFDRSIKLENISFAYKNDVSDALSNISLEIKKGEKVAVVGESGSGKSTLIDIIIGIHKPGGGKLLIDGIEITENNIGSWRSKIGYIPQNIYLFDGTVADNIVFAMNAEENKIIDVLKKANIWDFLLTKDGLHTKVGDGGIQLSGGQKQRVGIARALYNNPDVLVLDEATSSLDIETESKIMDEIYKLSENKTLIVIAHRLSTIKRCNRSIKISAGKLV